MLLSNRLASSRLTGIKRAISISGAFIKMSTPAQRLANQANAQNSSGPKTETGKAASAVNNRKHGFAGAFFLLPNEDEADYRQLNDGFAAEYQPINVIEQILVQKMVQHYWVSQRAHQMQDACAYEHQLDPVANNSLALFIRYQTTHDRAFHKCIEQLAKLRAERRKEQIGFDSQKRQQAAQEASEAQKQADETRRQELHQAKIRLLNSKAALTELDANIKGTLEAKFPGYTAIPFTDIKPFLETAIQDFVNYKTSKAA
jgi:hypothetical protein